MDPCIHIFITLMNVRKYSYPACDQISFRNNLISRQPKTPTLMAFSHFGTLSVFANQSLKTEEGWCNRSTRTWGNTVKRPDQGLNIAVLLLDCLLSGQWPDIRKQIYFHAVEEKKNHVRQMENHRLSKQTIKKKHPPRDRDAILKILLDVCTLHAWLTLRPWRWRQNVPLKRPWTSPSFTA
jgi:hypothetical protein